MKWYLFLYFQRGTPYEVQKNYFEASTLTQIKTVIVWNINGKSQCLAHNIFAFSFHVIYDRCQTLFCNNSYFWGSGSNGGNVVKFEHNTVAWQTQICCLFYWKGGRPIFSKTWLKENGGWWSQWSETMVPPSEAIGRGWAIADGGGAFLPKVGHTHTTRALGWLNHVMYQYTVFEKWGKI